MSQDNKLEPVSTEYLEYWIDNEPGGSGLSVTLQWRLKSMATELLALRQEVAILKQQSMDRSWQLEYYHQRERNNYTADGQWK